MGKTSRIISIFLVVVMVAALLATAAFAASQKRVSGTGGMVTVDTGDQKGYQFWNRPAITVKNTGSRTATIIIYDSRGRIEAQLTALKAGKSHTFKLDDNEKYTVGWSTHAMWGGKVSLTIAEKKNIDYIK